MKKNKIITILHENYVPLNKGYRRICIDKLNLLSNEYDIDLIMPSSNDQFKYLGLDKNIKTISFNRKLIGRVIGFIFSIFKLSPITISIYSDYFYKKRIKEIISKTNYNFVYLVTPRGLDNIPFYVDKSKIVVDFVDPFADVPHAEVVVSFESASLPPVGCDIQ